MAIIPPHNSDAQEYDNEVAEEIRVAEIDGSDEGDLDLASEHPKITLAKNDRALAEFFRWYNRGRIIVDPEWQRKYVWDKRRASKLMESFLIDLPVPVIYLSINDESNYEVIDGLQRLTSVFNFFENKFPLTGLEIRTDLNGKTFQELPEDLKSKLEDTTLRTFELSQTSPKDLMFLIFERLNTGGVALNDMEIRNCLYRGGLNDLIKELAATPDFQTALSQRGIQKRMLDRSLVLRFLAFYQLQYNKARKGLKAFLNEFFETYRNPKEEKLREFRTQFAKSAKAALTIFGEQAFRLRRDKSRGGGEWASRVNASVCQILMTSFTDYDLGLLTRSADNIHEAYVDLVSSDDRWVECVTSATADFSRIEYAFSTWFDRLKKAVKDGKANDSQRLFSRQLKQQLFEQDQSCAICGSRITLLLDAALDHSVRYWEGGRTIPENALLTHRQCNLERAKRK